MSEFVLDFEKVFNDHIDHNPKEWMYDRGESVGASEVYGCLRQAFLNKRGEEFGYERDEGFVQRWGATERGNIIENHFVVPAVSHHLPDELHLLYQGDHQTTLKQGRTTATPDGLITGFPKGCALTVKYKEHVIEIPNIISDCINFEIKSIDPLAVLTEERKKHNYQTHMQVGLIRETTEWEPHFTVILYIQASWLDDITPFVVEYNEQTYLTGKDRAEFVFKATDIQDIIAEGRLCDDCKYCEWTTACGTAVVDSVPKQKKELADADTGPLMDNVAIYNTAKAAKEASIAEMKIAQEHIKDLLHKNNSKGTKLPQDMGSVSWSTVKGKKSTDIKAMKEDGIDVEAYETTGNPYDRLTITMKKPKKIET